MKIKYLPSIQSDSHICPWKVEFEETFSMGDLSNVHIGPRRLSKPRTIKSSSNLLCEQPTTPSSPHSSSEQDYFGRDAVVINSHGESRSRSKSRGMIRAYLYGSSHDLTHTSSDDEEAQTGIAGAARDVRKRLSRTGSSITPLQSAKASVTRLSNSSSSGLLSTRSTESQPMDPEESAMIADQIKQKAYHDSLAAQNHVSTPVDEDRHVDSLMAPLRRKSLYTPGIATRNASDILRKPPKASTDQDYYYDTSHSETSPLSHLAALNLGEDGRSTPSDLHYSQLGGLQLGTLWVTNGASSPVPGGHTPELLCRSATPESKTHDEYYTASEGSANSDGGHATPLPPRGGSPLRHESKIEACMRTDNRAPSSPEYLSSFERESSSKSFPSSRKIAERAACFEKDATDQSARFRRETSNNIVRVEEGTSNESFPSKRRSSNICPVETTKPNNFLCSERETPNKPCTFEHESHDEIEHSEGQTPKDSLLPKIGPFQTCRVEERNSDGCFHFEGNSPNGASDIADEYIAELDSSPFSHPSLENTRDAMPQSQHPAGAMWRSFINDAEVQHADIGGGSREDALQKLTVNAHLPSTWQSERLPVPSSQPSRYSASSQMAQTDSGYCSHASLTGAPAHEVRLKSEGGSNPSTNFSASPPPQAIETIRSSARSSFRIPIRKLQKQRPKSQPPPVNFLSARQCHEFNDVQIPRVPSIIAARHADRLRQFPLLEHTFQSSQHTTADTTLSPTESRHELIRFPSPANALEAASASSRSPPAPSSKHRVSKTVVEEDERGVSDLVRSPSWSEFGGGRKRKEQKKLAKEDRQLEKRLQKEKKDDDKQRSAGYRTASRTRASSQHDPLLTIADFGTVTESLGKSPYDIATAMSKPPNTSTIASNWHPHQMSTAMPRPKSMIATDEAAATDLAHAGRRNRSQSFEKLSVGQAVRTSTSCGSHEPQATGDSGTKDKAFATASALLGLSMVNLTGSNVVPSKKVSTSAPQTATPLKFLPHMPNQRIPSERDRDFSGGNRPQSLFGGAPSVPALAAVDFKAHDVNWARDRQRSQTFSAARAEAFDDRGGYPEKSKRLDSDTPPVPALPSIQQVKQREAEIIRSRSHSMIIEAPVSTFPPREIDQRKAVAYPPELGTSGTPRKTRGSKIVPDLWSNGSLERKSPKAVERSNQASSRSTRESGEALPAKDNLWESQSYAWSQRRKSAGEALLRNQVRDVSDGEEAPSVARAFTSGGSQSFTPSPSHLGPFPNPLALHPQLTAVQQPTYTSNTPIRYDQSATQQTQLPGFCQLASPTGPSGSSFQRGNQISSPTLRRAQTQSFQIPRKRVGSGSSILRTETTIGSGRYEGVLV